MADPSTGAPDDPYHDPYDGPFTEEELFNVISDLNPSLVDLSLSDPVVDVNPPPASMEAGNAHNPRELEAMTDPRGSDNDQTLSWMNIGQLGRENVGEGNKLGEGSTLEASSWEMSNDRSNCYEAGETSMPASVRRTSSEDVFVCSCCQLLREFIHTNGQQITRLEVHGRIGKICHANLEVQPDAATSEEYQYHTFHFNEQSNEKVKEFIYGAVLCGEG
ncbi:PREDICTED: uncharacterized protein LOC104820951 isoform X3 [Tarenaya hassleriana]|uniref:uncharacterized protein LOC104820951 isoform X3 n=1 Tax=Tarenaya hassleriana TaxID=28532 RepID=UPI00053C1B38|nr:PREDICTED: uncharacterized protein LOC104820951 isoform X3 [Tarenaya hassleriana]